MIPQQMRPTASAEIKLKVLAALALGEPVVPWVEPRPWFTGWRFLNQSRTSQGIDTAAARLTQASASFNAIPESGLARKRR